MDGNHLSASSLYRFLKTQLVLPCQNLYVNKKRHIAQPCVLDENLEAGFIDTVEKPSQINQKPAYSAFVVKLQNTYANRYFFSESKKNNLTS